MLDLHVLSGECSQDQGHAAASHTGLLPGGPISSTLRPPFTELLDVEAGTATLGRQRVMSPAGEPPFHLVDAWVSSESVWDAQQTAEASIDRGRYLSHEEAEHGPLLCTEYACARMPSRDEAQLIEISEEISVLIEKMASPGSTLRVTA